MRLPVKVGVIVALSSLVATPSGRFVVLVGSALSVARCESTEDCTALVVPDTLPDGRVGHLYFFQLGVEATGADCFGADDFDEIDMGERGLPPGMKLSEDGALDGIPLRAGSYSFEVTGHYWYDGGEDAYRGATTRRYSLTILPR